MATIRASINRINRLTQDRDNSAWTDSRKRQALQEEVDRLARLHLFGEIRQEQAIAAQGRYPLPLDTLEVSDVAYDATTLWEVSEDSLRNAAERWEEDQQFPKVWTQERQPMSQDASGRPLKSIEVHPAPAASGPDIPVFPAVPLSMPIERNFVIFSWQSPQLSNDDTAEMPIPRVLQQVANYRAVSQLSSEKTDYEDLPKAKFFDELSTLVLKALEG